MNENPEFNTLVNDDGSVTLTFVNNTGLATVISEHIGIGLVTVGINPTLSLRNIVHLDSACTLIDNLGGGLALAMEAIVDGIGIISPERIIRGDPGDEDDGPTSDSPTILVADDCLRGERACGSLPIFD